VACNSAIRQEIGRVGKNHIKAAIGMFGGNGVENGETIPMVKINSMRVIAEDGLDGNCSGVR
jgi:hypothetical protein